MSAIDTLADVARPARWRGHLRLATGAAITATFVGVALLALVWTPDSPTRAAHPAEAAGAADRLACSAPTISAVTCCRC